MEKRGSSHIEVILSFVLFLTFLGAAVYFFNPADAPSMAEPSLSRAMDSIIAQSAIDLDSYSVVIKDGSPEIVAVNIEENQDYNARVEDYKGNILDSRRSGNWVYLNRNGNKEVIIKFSRDFSAGSMPGSPDEDKSKYILASSSTRKVISEKRINEMQSKYKSDYSALRSSDFKLPANVDFSFFLVFSQNDRINAEKEIPSRAEVFSDVQRKEVLRSSGEQVFADLSVKVW